MSSDFGNARLDPDREKATAVQEDNEKRNEGQTVKPDAQKSPNTRKSSAYGRARSSVTTLRASLARETGWSKESGHIWGEKRRSTDVEGGEDATEDGDDIDYQTLEWWQAGMIMIAETISLGILSLPSVLATIGIVPGMVIIAGMGILATYTGYVMGQFRLMYPWVHSFGDAGEILGKPIKMGRFFSELFGWAQTVFQIFTMASHILTWTICFNTITDSATCTMVWGVIGLVVFWLLDLPRTLKKVSYMSIASFISIFSAVMVTMIDVGIERPIGSASLAATEKLGFTGAFLSVSNIVFAFAGHSCFFGFMSEFKNVEEWPKALALLQICDTTMYLVAAIVIYRYAGPQVRSPALGSAGPVVRKAAWGIAIPTIIIAGVIYGHIAAKYIFVRLFRGTKHLTKRTKLSNIMWFTITLTVWIIAFIIAESIPNFNDLLALVSSLFASWFTYGIPGVFWLFMNYGQWFKNWKKICLFVANWLVFGIGAAICILGLWSSGDSIAKATGGHSWTCASNAQ